MGAIGVLASMIFVALSLDLTTPSRVNPATHDDGTFVSADPGQPTYILSNFRIEYPWAEVNAMPGMEPGSVDRERYCNLPSRRESCKSQGNAGFFYDWEWSSDQPPGNIACRVTLYSRDGEQVGQQVWEMTALEPESREPSHLLVHVSGKPERAEAACEAGSYEEGAGYRFVFTGQEIYKTDFPPNIPDRIRLHFDVEVLAEHQPMTRMCTMRVVFESGEVKEGSFTITGLQEGPRHYDTGYPASDPVRDASITCRPMPPSEKEQGSPGKGFVTLVIDKRDGCLAEPSTPQRFRVQATFKKGSDPTKSCP